MLLTNSLGKIDLNIWNEVTKAQIDTKATLSVLNPTSCTILLPQSTETEQMVEVSNQPLAVSKSLLIPFQPASIQETH